MFKQFYTILLNYYYNYYFIYFIPKFVYFGVRNQSMLKTKQTNPDNVDNFINNIKMKKNGFTSLINLIKKIIYLSRILIHVCTVLYF